MTTTARPLRVDPHDSDEATDTAGAQARAHRLCAAAEPHSAASPCDRHVREAWGQLVSLQASATGQSEDIPGFWV